MRYKDLFIDFDDTLYDTYNNANVALKETFGFFHLELYFPDPQTFYDAYWTTNIDLWRQYSKGEITRDYLIVERFRRPLSTGAGLVVTEKLCLEMSDVFLDCCSSKSGVVEGAHELMDYLREKGYRMHMCSNGFHEIQYKKLEASGLRDYFDNIILSEDAGANKPSPIYFDYAFKVSGARREDTLMIGDNIQNDIQGALNSGVDALLFNRWGIDVTESAITPTYVVKTLEEIKNIL
jgi:putative hydrolase of the HAD superfamily